jgi:hypothetical protein
LQDRVEAPEPVRLAGVRVQVRPVDGLRFAARLTAALKPPKAVIVTLEVPEAPAFIVTLTGFATIVKSWTV